MENGVKNLKGAWLFPKTFSNNGNGDAYFEKKRNGNNFGKNLIIISSSKIRHNTKDEYG